MALATHQLKVSNSTFPSVSSSRGRRSKLKHSLNTFHSVGGKDRFISFKSRCCSRSGAFPVLGQKSKLFKISAFEGSSQYDDSNGSEPWKNAVKFSYLQEKRDESLVDSSNVQNGIPGPYTKADESTRPIQDLFKKWLMLLHMPSESQPVKDVLEEPFSSETLEIQIAVQNQQRGEALKKAWGFFMGLDATVKIPLLLVVPMYLAVTLVYGLKVSKELTPLWIIGPFIVSLYVKTIQAVCQHCVLKFKQTVNTVKTTLHVCYTLAHVYFVDGKLKEAMRIHLLKPVLEILNTDYIEISRRKMKDLQVEFEERRLDYREAIWPYYCRTHRFLMKSQVI